MANDRNGTPIVVGNKYILVGEVLDELADGRVVLDVKRVRWTDTTGSGQPTMTPDSVDLVPLPAGGGGATDLGIAARTGTTLDVTSSTGTDATVPAASATEAGLMTAAEQVKLAGIEAGAVAAGAAGDAYATSHEADTTAHTAAEIVNTPAGSIASTDVQAAINELDTEKAAVSHTHAQADITNLVSDLAGKQASDAFLTSIAALGTAADKMIYTTAADTAAEAAITAAGRAILDDADAAAQRTTLGLGTAALRNMGVGASDLIDLGTQAATWSPLGHTHDATDLASGTIAAARMPALTGDVTTTVGTVATTIGAGKVTMAMLANIATDKLIGRDASGTGVPTAIGVTGAISFNGSDSITIANGAVTSALLRDSAALSVIGRSANSTGVPADIATAADGDVLRRSGTTLGFGALAIHGARMPAVYQTAALGSQRAITTSKTVAAYIGRVSELITSVSVMYYVLTAAVTITWAEIGIAKGTPVLNAGATLTPVGHTNVAAVVNSTGFKTGTISVAGGQSLGLGDHLWLLFGNQATTVMSIQCASLLNEWTGLTLNATTRPSTTIGTGVAYGNESDYCPYAIVL